VSILRIDISKLRVFASSGLAHYISDIIIGAPLVHLSGLSVQMSRTNST
jgi:hypothetical protein